MSWKRLSMSSGSNGLCLRSHLAAGWNIFFSQGAIKPPGQRSSPFFPEVHDELTISWHTPHSSRIRPSTSASVISVDDAEEKECECLPPLDESVAAYLCPPAAIGWNAKASHLSKLCICIRRTHLLGGWTSVFGAAHMQPVFRMVSTPCHVG